MRAYWAIPVIASILILGGLGISQQAFAATPASVTHIYELNDDYLDSLGGPALIPTGGSIDANRHNILARNQGLSLSNGINPSEYSIETIFEFDSVVGPTPLESWRKIIDFKDRSIDSGLYNNVVIRFFAPENPGNSGLAANTDAHVVITRDGATKQVVVYLNGVQEFSFTDTFNRAVFDKTNNIIHFFKDDFATNERESSPGSVDRIRIYDGVLTSSEVTSIFNGGSPPGGEKGGGGGGDPDSDGDGVPDSSDVCPGFDDTIDTDGDTIPDGCDATPNGDNDNDGVDNLADNCVNDANLDQSDIDGDGVGDVCDATPNGDDDNDGVDNLVDVCPGFDDNIDTDADGVPDGCDTTPGQSGNPGPPARPGGANGNSDPPAEPGPPEETPGKGTPPQNPGPPEGKGKPN